jgi:hypothetical protein
MLYNICINTYTCMPDFSDETLPDVTPDPTKLSLKRSEFVRNTLAKATNSHSVDIQTKYAEILNEFGAEEAENFLADGVMQLFNSGLSDFEISSLTGRTPCEISTIRSSELKKLADNIKNTDPNEFIGSRVNYYRYLQKVCNQGIKKNKNAPANMKNFIEMAIKAEESMHKMLETAGFYKYKEFDPGTNKYKASEDALEIKQFLDTLVDDEE